MGLVPAGIICEGHVGLGAALITVGSSPSPHQVDKGNVQLGPYFLRSWHSSLTHTHTSELQKPVCWASGHLEPAYGENLRMEHRGAFKIPLLSRAWICYTELFHFACFFLAELSMVPVLFLEKGDTSLRSFVFHNSWGVSPKVLSPHLCLRRYATSCRRLLVTLSVRHMSWKYHPSLLFTIQSCFPGKNVYIYWMRKKNPNSKAWWSKRWIPHRFIWHWFVHFTFGNRGGCGSRHPWASPGQV